MILYHLQTHFVSRPGVYNSIIFAYLIDLHRQVFQVCKLMCNQFRSQQIISINNKIQSYDFRVGGIEYVFQKPDAC